jgi:hypothetical protein
MKKSMFTVLCLFVALLPLTLIGCGGGGSGTDATSTPPKTVTINQLLAVDDIIVNATVKYGTELDSNGRLKNGTFMGTTDQTTGKVNSTDLSITPKAPTLFFEVTGGKSGTVGGTDLGTTDFFTGVVELNTDETSNQTITRINVNPFTTLISLVKSKHTTLSLNKIAQEAVLPFFATTSIGTIDINTSSYEGKSADSGVETTGDAPLLQTMSEMLKVAAKKANNASSITPTLLSSFIASSLTDITSNPEKPIFNSFTGDFSKAMSETSSDIKNNLNSVHGGFFSTAINIITTNGSFNPTSFETGTPKDTHFKIKSLFQIDGTTAKINFVSNYQATITSSDGNALVLTSVPSIIILSNNGQNYKPILDTDFYIKWEKNSNDYIELTVRNARIEVSGTDDIFKMFFTTNSKLDGTNKETNSSETLKEYSIKNTEEFKSIDKDHISLDINQILEWGEGILSRNDLKSKTEARFGNTSANITIEFKKNVFFSSDNFSSELFNKIIMNGVTLSN